MKALLSYPCSKKTLRNFLFLLFAEVILLAGALVWACHHIGRLAPADISILDMTCPYTVYHDGAFSVEDDMVNSGNEVNFLYGPELPLSKGTYAAIIKYETEYDQYVTAYGTNSNLFLVKPAEFVKASKGILSSSKQSIIYEFEIPENTAKFQLIFNYNGQGEYKIKDLSILQTGKLYQRSFMSLFFILAGINIAFIVSKSGKNVRKNVLTVLCISFFASIPVFFNQSGLFSGDLEFHLLRIEAVAKAISDLQFPPRISSLWMDGYGFPASIYYNDFFLVFPAALRVIGYDITTSYKAYIVVINVLSAAVSLWAFSRIFRNRKIGILVTIAYILAPYRLTDIYLRSAVGEYTAIAFLPLIAYGIVNMFQDDGKDRKKYHSYGIIMAVGITGVVAAHILTLLMVVLFLLFIFLIEFKKSIRKNTLCLWIDTGILSILLSAYFLIPFMDYYFSVDTIIKQNTVVRGSGMIQYNGISLGKLLSFFPTSFPDVTLEYLPLTPGLLLFLVLISGFRLYFVDRNRKLFLFLFFSAVSIFLSMDCFPWNFLEAHSYIGQILAQIQFPFRFLAIADVILCLLLGYLLQAFETDQRFYAVHAGEVIITLSGLFLFLFVSGINVLHLSETKYSTTALNTFTTGWLYLPADASIDRSSYTADILSGNVEKAEILSRKTHTMKIQVESKNGGWLEVPILNYKGYHVQDSFGNEFEIYTGTNNRIGFRIPEQFTGTVIVEFIDPWYWRAAIYVSLISLLLLLIAAGKRRNRNPIGPAN